MNSSPAPFISSLLSQGFSLESEISSNKDFGNFKKVYASQDFKLRLTKDRGQFFIDLSENTSHAQWIDLLSFLAFLKVDCPESSLFQTALNNLGRIRKNAHALSISIPIPKKRSPSL